MARLCRWFKFAGLARLQVAIYGHRGPVVLTFEVASSRMRILAFCSRARAMHSSCRWPVLRLAPPSTSSASSRPCARLMQDVGASMPTN